MSLFKRLIRAIYAPPKKVSAWVGDMSTSAGMEYCVCVGYEGGEYLTPHVFTVRSHAEYEVASWNHLFGYVPEPNVLDYEMD